MDHTLPATTASTRRRVGCLLRFGVDGPTTLALCMAPAVGAGELLEERLEITLGGQALPSGAVQEVATAHGGRLHVVRTTAPGELAVTLDATVDPLAAGPTQEGPVLDHRGGTVDDALVTYLRQSRYCPSDELSGFAAGELAELAGRDDEQRAQAVAEWVFGRFAYVAGSSGPLTTAVDTLLAGAGVCRDFAHLTVALARSIGIPARLVSVYAPGLSPMDFHAVAEVLAAGRWVVLDATRMAPRSSLVRIATGRDAADTAFASTLDGDAELLAAEVHAVVDGDLPLDDHADPVALDGA